MDSGVATAFRAVRERHGVSIVEAARTLGVNVAYLAAIEDGSIEQVASEVAAKAHLRVYARYLGFDSEAVLQGDPPGIPSPEAPISRHGEPDDASLFDPRRRVAPPAAARRRSEPEAAEAPVEGPALVRDHGAARPAPVEEVDDPPDLDADLDELASGRRRLAALAIAGSLLLGLLIAFAIGSADAAGAAVGSG